MPISPQEKRKKTPVVTKPAQLAGMGILTPPQDREGNKIATIQPTVVHRPNALQSRAFEQGSMGYQSMPKAGLADMAIQANQASANLTGSGMSYAGLSDEDKKKRRGLL